jgi:hypothetical protein
MTNQEIVNGLNQLGVNSGYVVTGDEITLWELNTPQPSQKALIEAAGLWAQTEADKQAQAATDKAALLAKLGITANEAKLLLS